METAVGGSWTRVRTLGRGASGAVVSLAADDLSGALFAVKSAPAAAAAAEQLRREGDILSGLCSPHVLPCLGFRAGAAGECQLFLEFAPGGSVADVAERSGGRLEECAVRAYAADVARGLAYLHGRSLVHGDVKGRNVVVRGLRVREGGGNRSARRGHAGVHGAGGGAGRGAGPRGRRLGAGLHRRRDGHRPRSVERHGRRPRGDAPDRLHGRRAGGAGVAVRGGLCTRVLYPFLACALLRQFPVRNAMLSSKKKTG